MISGSLVGGEIWEEACAEWLANRCRHVVSDMEVGGGILRKSAMGGGVW